jgi:hypothetical protein
VKVSSRKRLIIIGGFAGAALGATAGWALGKSMDAPQTAGRGKQLSLTASAPDLVKFGMSVLALVRQASTLIKTG